MTDEELRTIRDGVKDFDFDYDELLDKAVMLLDEVESLLANYENAVTSGVAAVNYGIQREATLLAEVERVKLVFDAYELPF